MATWLETVNNVQRRLRSEVTSSVTTTDYSTLLGQFVNDAKREVENRWLWSDFITTESGTFNASQDTVVTTVTGRRVVVLDIYNDDGPYKLIKKPKMWILDRIQEQGTVAEGRPLYWAFDVWTPADATRLIFSPRPSSAENYTMIYWKPQDDLAADGTEIELEAYPIELGAYLRAISERGEDGGAVFDEVSAQYQRAISDMLGREQKMNPTTRS